MDNHNAVCTDGITNGWLDYRMCALHTGGKLEPFHRGKFMFVSQVFSKEGRIIQNFKVEIFL